MRACGHVLVYQNGGMNNRWLQEQVPLTFHPDCKSLLERQEQGLQDPDKLSMPRSSSYAWVMVMGVPASLSFLYSGSKRETPENTIGHHAPILQIAEISCIDSLVCFF